MKASNFFLIGVKFVTLGGHGNLMDNIECQMRKKMKLNCGAERHHYSMFDVQSVRLAKR